MRVHFTFALVELATRQNSMGDTLAVPSTLARTMMIERGIVRVEGGAATVHPIGVLNVMGLETPQSAVLSAIIFNALIIPLLVPLALKGVRYRPMAAGPLLARNLSIYGLGGLVAPFVGIKLIDLAVSGLHLA